VGATAPAELRAIRAVVPGLGFLVPGLGAQGGSLEAVLEAGPATTAPAGGRPGGGLLVNVSRAIAGAATGASGPASTPGSGPPSGDPGERLAAAARAWSGKLAVLP
jgi:orotidine-5'-phosphate decarboxylase